MKKNLPIIGTAVLNRDALLDSVLQAAGEGIICIDHAGIVLLWNPAAEKLFGLSAAEVTGHPASVFLDADDEIALKSVTEKIRNGSIIGRHELKCRRSGNIYTDISLTISAFIVTPGTVPGLCIIARDISSDKQRERELNQSIFDLRAIFDHAKEGFVLVDTDCRIKAFNARARESIVLNNTGEKPAVGQSLFVHIAKDRQSDFKEITEKVLLGKTIRYDRAYPQPDGSRIWFDFSLNPVYDGNNVTGICITGNNITERKLTEQKLQEKEKRFRAIVENSADAVTILTPEGIPTYMAPTIESVLGYTEAEAVDLNLFDLAHPDDRNELSKLWNKVLNSPGIVFRGYPCRILHKNGSWRYIEGTITNLLHEPAIGGIVDNFRDITDKIETEKRLRLSEELYRQLFYNNPQAMWIYDPVTLRFLDINNAMVDTYGYTREEFQQMTLLDIRDTNDGEKTIAAARERADLDANKAGTWKHRAKDGSYKFVEIRSHRIDYEERKAILVLANDVTKQKIATDLLLESSREKANILERITDGFFAIDRDYTVVYWNKAAEDMSTMKRGAILGRNLWEVYGDSLTPIFRQEYERAIREQVAVQFEEYYAPLSLWLDVSAYPSPDGLSVFFKNVTERKTAQDKIKRIGEQFELIAKVTNDAIYEWDITEDVNYWGEGYETLFGHKRTGDKMPTTTWIDNLHPDERPEILTSVQEAFEQQVTTLKRELRFRCADGAYKTVYDKLVIIYGESGKPLRIIGGMHDITERKAQEIAINRLNEELNKRAEDLSKSNEELERFAYVASHDLQEPLRMVGSFLQLLQRKYKGQLDDTAMQYIEYAVDGATRMKGLIEDLLEYSRVGSKEAEITSVDINEVMSTLMRTFIEKISETSAIIDIHDMPVIRANQMHITQLIQNLISNSFKYNDSPVPEITISCEELPDHWEFHFRDNGIGIDKKFFDKVFVIFQRLHNRNQHSGTGIGLAICKKIVERYGGRIWIESELGQGSSFIFTIAK